MAKFKNKLNMNMKSLYHYKPIGVKPLIQSKKNPKAVYKHKIHLTDHYKERIGLRFPDEIQNIKNLQKWTENVLNSNKIVNDKIMTKLGNTDVTLVVKSDNKSKIVITIHKKRNDNRKSNYKFNETDLDLLGVNLNEIVWKE